MDDIDFDGLAERYWSRYDPAFQDDEDDYENEDDDYTDEDEESEDDEE